MGKGRLEDDEDVKHLNFLALDPSVPDEDLVTVCEANNHLVKIDTVGGFDSRVAGLSWRWDVRKPDNQAAAEKIRSKKLLAFVQRAKKEGFKYAWAGKLRIE